MGVAAWVRVTFPLWRYSNDSMDEDLTLLGYIFHKTERLTAVLANNDKTDERRTAK